MNACPICRAAWSGDPSLRIQHAVCPVCFAIFQRQDNQWKQVPPGWEASSPIRFPLGTTLRLRSAEYRVVGFASYSYEFETGRDQWETIERHEYTLSGEDIRLLCWTSDFWFLARPVDASQVISKSWAEAEFEGRVYQRQLQRTFKSQRACGYLARPFGWHQFTSISDLVSADRHVVAQEDAGNTLRWVGEILNPQELGLPPADLTYVPQTPAMSAAAVPKRSSSLVLPTLGILVAVAAILVVIGTGAYQYERSTKPVRSDWFACELQPSQAIVAVPAGASRLELNPHLPQGALRYELRILNKQGAALATYKDFLDMNPKRSTVEFKFPGDAASVEAVCALSVRVAGLPSWPVELRFFR